MHKRYNLKKMLEEIREDEKLSQGSKNVKVSQDDIKKLMAKRKDKK